jgi:hypothetical protein
MEPEPHYEDFRTLRRKIFEWQGDGAAAGLRAVRGASTPQLQLYSTSSATAQGEFRSPCRAGAAPMAGACLIPSVTLN